ncbi:putative allatostatin [Halotydeus destructor]|nr:putative allatostatin [Halotydeus destructor]
MLTDYLLVGLVAMVTAVPESSPGTLMAKPMELDQDTGDLLEAEGKRAPQQYNFGLGKKADNWLADWAYYGPEGASDSEPETYDKRASGRQYGFGLGKKAAPGPETRYAFGLGKRAAPRYAFGLGKRPVLLKYGPGKKAANRFAFGLGKRDSELGFDAGGDYGDEMDKRRRFEFGLGKRPQGQRYSFGIGRR